MVLGAHGVTGAEILEAHGGADISRFHKIDGILMVGVHLEEA